ncbi:hypothetical protein [Gaoshiqia sp. Z1-71]|uniref:hypothetical protein n=1 Tax=Gaoshiqia hydrogeniformans TaxID=3290090 RepID=UPI003BF8E30E
MERRDYLIDQIHQLGLFIAKLIDRLQKKKDQGQEDQLFTEAADAFCVQFGWDMEELLFLDDRSFIGLMDENLLANEHFEQMAAVFELLGDHALEHETLLRKELYLQKALLLLNYVEHKSHTYSMERRDRIVQLESKLAL